MGARCVCERTASAARALVACVRSSKRPPSLSAGAHGAGLVVARRGPAAGEEPVCLHDLYLPRLPRPVVHGRPHRGLLLLLRHLGPGDVEAGLHHLCLGAPSLALPPRSAPEGPPALTPRPRSPQAHTMWHLAAGASNSVIMASVCDASLSAQCRPRAWLFGYVSCRCLSWRPPGEDLATSSTFEF